MRILIQGIGSIGQRHYRNLSALGHTVALLRSSATQRPFVETFFKEEEAAGRSVVVFEDLDVAVSEFKPEALVICTPNNLHLGAALEGAKRGLHLFIEKPVHMHEEGVAELERIVAEKKLTVMVGYNLRFHPLLVEVKRMLEKGEMGTVLSAAVEVGENIEDWHPWEDYRDTYGPYAARGGGSLLCFSHDIDYLYWLLGEPSGVAAGGGKITPLAGDAEDLVQGLWKYQSGAVATLHIDYWQRPKVRTLKIIGSEKTLMWDAYGDLTVYLHADGSVISKTPPEGFERNTMFVEEMQHFVSCIEERKLPRVPLSDAVAVVRLIDKMKAVLTA